MSEVTPISHWLGEHPSWDTMPAGRAWLLLMGMVAVCLPPLVAGLGAADTRHTMECIALMSSQETWLRQRGWHDVPADPWAWLMPTRNGQPRLEKPPMVVWLHLLAWSDLQPQTADATRLTLRARYVAVGVGLLLIASTYWAGMTLGGWRVAAMAGLVVGTTWFFQRQARTASYDIHMAAWVTLAVAAGWWAMAPLGQQVGSLRWAAGMAIAAAALTLAILSKGPLALVMTWMPWAVTLAMDRRRWRTHGLGLLAATFVALAAWQGWYAYAASFEDEAGLILRREFIAERSDFQPPWYYLGLLALILPWTLWMIGGMIHPFVRAAGRRRKQLLIAWIWFVLVFIFFSLPGAKQQRYILPIAPAVAILIAQVFRDHAALVAMKRHDRDAIRLSLPHWVGVLTVSVLFGPMVLMQDRLVSWDVMDEPLFGDVAWGWVIAVMSGMVVMAILGSWFHLARGHALAGAAATAVWMSVSMSLFWWAYSRGPERIHPIRDEGERVAAMVGNAPLRHLRPPDSREGLNEEFLFYARRIAYEIRGDEVDSARDTAKGPLYVIASSGPAQDQAMARSGFTAVMAFEDDHDSPQRLWCWRPSTDERVEP